MVSCLYKINIFDLFDHRGNRNLVLEYRMSDGKWCKILRILVVVIILCNTPLISTATLNSNEQRSKHLLPKFRALRAKH